MLGWSKPTCPVDVATKDWVERHLCWLTSKLGEDRVRYTDVVLPTEVYFPHPYDAEPKSVLRLLRGVCRFMEVDQHVVRFKTYKAHQLSRLARRQHVAAKDTAHHYIWFEETLLDDYYAMIGAFARELALVRMRISDWRAPEYGDGTTCWLDPNWNECFQPRTNQQDDKLVQLADLLTVLLGMGVFTANTVLLEENWRLAGVTAGWRARYMGSISMETYGYALALFAWYRGEMEPLWSRHLRGTAALTFKKGLDYLLKTSDSQFAPPR
jgi:hypothetical protein